MNYLNNRRQRGIGLLELMLSLAIIAILLVMATRYYLVTSRNQQMNQAVTQIGIIQGAIANWKGSNPDYGPTGALSAEALYLIGAIPSSDYDATGKYINSPWSTEVDVASTDSNKGYTITYINLPTWGACANLGQKYEASGGVCTGTTFTLTFDPSLQ